MNFPKLLKDHTIDSVETQFQQNWAIITEHFDYTDK